MSEINGVGNSVLADLALKPQAQNKELDKNAFLKLMVAQLNNQDPLSPQENGEFISQLAQFSSVEGIENMNKTMGLMANGMQSSQALQASALVGRSVHVAADSSYLPPGGIISGLVKLESSTTDLRVNIRNETGELVRQVAMGQQSRGNVNFAWTGMDEAGNQLPPGKYLFSAEASVGSENQQMDMALSANVNSVTINPDRTVVLNLAGQGAVPLLDVEEIL